MEKENVPQDESALGKHTKEMCYATDAQGNYVTALSSGWEIKATALNVAWDDIENRINLARQKVLNNEASPLLFFMEYRLMDLKILADYSGFWTWQIKRHLKPQIFKKLSEKQLQQYATVFNVSVGALKNMKVDE